MFKNVFLHNFITTIHYIDSNTLYSEIIHKTRNIGSIKGFEPTFLPETKGK